MWRLVCDADQHVNEPKDLYTKWLPAKFQNEAPKVVKLPNGGDAWEKSGRLSPMGLSSTAGRNFSQIKNTGVSYDEMRPGEYDPVEHLKDMDIDGIYSACFFSGPGSNSISPEDGHEFYLAGIQAWNNFMIDGFCAVDPDRLVALPKMPITGLEDSILEFKRVASKGVKGVIISCFPNGTTDMFPDDDRFWAEAEEQGIPVAIHVGFGNRAGQGPGGPITQISNINASRTAANMHKVLSDIAYSGVLERFPKLTILSVETGVGWFPFFLEQADDNYQRHRFWANINLKLRPSEYIKRQVLATFQIDSFGVRNRHDFGVENIMWSSDYPHSGADWPNSQKLIEFHMQGVPEEEKLKMLGGNYARVFKLRGPA